MAVSESDQFLTGTATEMPQLLNAPDPYVIGSIHVHPPGSQWLEGPSGPDLNAALDNNVYFIIRTVNGMYLVPRDAPSGWSSSNPPGARECC